MENIKYESHIFIIQKRERERERERGKSICNSFSISIEIIISESQYFSVKLARCIIFRRSVIGIKLAPYILE